MFPRGLGRRLGYSFLGEPRTGLPCVLLLAVVGVLSRGLAKRQRDATRTLELHAWHLRRAG